MRRQAEDIRVQKFKQIDAHLFIASARQSGNQVEAVFAVQFFFGDPLDDVQKLLRDETFQFAKGLLLQNRADLFPPIRYALPEDLLSNFLKQWRGRVRQVPLQLFGTLERGDLRKPIAWKLQELRHLLVDICSIGGRRQLLAGQDLGDVGVGNFGGARQIFLFKTQFPLTVA